MTKARASATPGPVLLVALAAAGWLLARPAARVDSIVAPARPDGAGRPRGWLPVAKRVAASFGEDRVMAQAAAVTYYALLALFPALASLISIYGIVANPAGLMARIDSLQDVVPGGGLDIVRQQVQALTSSSHKALGLGALIGIAASLWSANAGTKSLFDALNVVHHEKEKRSFIRLTLVTLLFTLSAVGFVILALLAVVAVPIFLNTVGLGGVADTLLDLLRWPVLLVLLTFALAVTYRVGPSHQAPRWRWISWGSVVAAFGWLLVSLAFSYYVSHFGSYNKTYGSLGAVIGFMTWIWISAIVVLMGAEVNAALED